MIPKRAVLIIGILLLASLAYAQDPAGLLAGAYESPAYPDYDFRAHPTVLLRVKSPLDSLEGSASLDYSDELKTRLDDSLGALGGTWRERVTDLAGRFAYESLTPRKDGGLLLGGYAGGGFKAYDLAKARYETPTQNLVTQTLDWPLAAGAAGSLAWTSGKLEQAYGLAYDFAFLPHYFTATTDAGQQPPRVAIGAAGRDADTFDHGLRLKGDWAGRLGYLDARLGASYRLGYVGRNGKYLAIDSDEDGLPDSVKSYAEWVGMGGQKGGPARAVSSSSILDMTFSHRADLDLLVGLELAKTLRLLLDLSYMPIDLSIRDSHARILDSVTVKDESGQRRVVMSDWGNASGMLVLALSPAKESSVSWRLGVGYERTGYGLNLDGTQASGLSLYSRENAGRFVEAALGLQPVNGQAKIACGDPTLTVSHTLRAVAAFEWRPARELSLLGSIEARAGRRELTYRVFNTSTRSVWQETETADDLAWGFSPRLCLSFPFGKDATLSAMLGPSKGASGYARNHETAPYDLTLGRQSSDGTAGLEERSDLAFDYSLRLTVRR